MTDTSAEWQCSQKYFTPAEITADKWGLTGGGGGEWRENATQTSRWRRTSHATGARKQHCLWNHPTHLHHQHRNQCYQCPSHHKYDFIFNHNVVRLLSLCKHAFVFYNKLTYTIDEIKVSKAPCKSNLSNLLIIECCENIRTIGWVPDADGARHRVILAISLHLRQLIRDRRKLRLKLTDEATQSNHQLLSVMHTHWLINVYMIFDTKQLISDMLSSQPISQLVM